MTREDYIDLVEITDDYEKLDILLRLLTGMGHGGGSLSRLDNLYEVLLRNANAYYRSDEEDGEAVFYEVLENRNRSPEERAEILMGGTIRRYRTGEDISQEVD